MTIMERTTEEYQDALTNATTECRKGAQCYGMEDYSEGWKDIENPFDHIEDMDADTLYWVGTKLEEQYGQLEKIIASIFALADAKHQLQNIDDYEE